MAQPPLTYNSFSNLPPGSPPPPPPARAVAPPQPEPPPVGPPADAGRSPEPVVPAAPPVATVQVVESVPAAPPARPDRRRWPVVGGVLGLAAGLGLGMAYHDRLPAEYEAAAALRVAGPTPDTPAAEAAIVRSPKVLAAAAARLPAEGPLEAPPASDPSAYLGGRLRVAATPGTGPTNAGGLNLTFRGPTAGDALASLRAVLHAYKDDYAARFAAEQAKAPPAVIPATDAEKEMIRQADEARRRADDRQRLEADLPRLTAEAKAAAARLPGRQAELDRVRENLAALDRRAAAATAPPPRPVGTGSDDVEVTALKARKAELGRRLGPEHRDMLALDEQIRAAERRADAARPNPPGPPASSQAAVEAERAPLVAQAAFLAELIRRDEAAGPAAAAAKAELDRLTATLNPPPVTQVLKMNPTPAPPPAPPAFVTVTVTAPPVDAVEVKPPAWRSLLPGGLGGLAVGAGLGYLLSLLVPVAAYRTARTPAAPRPAKPAGEAVTAKRAARRAARGAAAEDAAAFGMPVLAHVPAIQTDQPPEKRSGDGFGPSLVSFLRPSSPEGVAFQTARRGLTAALADRGHVVVLVTGPGPGDGKTTVAANLAVSLARAGKRVILVDCDLRSPGVQGVFNLGRLGDGLRGVMTADVDLRLAVRSCEVGNLFLLPAGRGHTDPADLLSRPKFRELIADLRAGYEYVLLDGPPATAEKELAALAEYPDGAVLAVRAGADAVARAEWGRGQLTAAGVKLLGAVVNVTAAVPDEPTPAPGQAAAPA